MYYKVVKKIDFVNKNLIKLAAMQKPLVNYIAFL